MVVTPEEAARALVGRARREHEALEARRDELRARIPEAAALLRERFGAARVILFGSLAWGGFHPRSDIDLATAGIPDGRAGEATADVSRLLSHPVEIFRLEELPEAFRRRILAEGEEVA